MNRKYILMTKYEFKKNSAHSINRQFLIIIFCFLFLLKEVMPEIHHSDSNESLPLENNDRLPSFNNWDAENEGGSKQNGEKFREWYEVVHIKSYNDELLTILPYVVID